MRKSAAALALFLAFALPTACAHGSADRPARSEAELVFEGIDRFYAVADTIAAGREPSAAAWDALFAAPGYARYLAADSARAAEFADRVRLAFDPARGDEVTDALSALHPFNGRPLVAVLAARERRTDIEAFRRSLATGDLIGEAVPEAARLLPEGSDPALPVVFHIYTGDGTGLSDRIIMDLTLAEKMGREGTRLFVAHELHHGVRDGLSALRMPERSEDPRHYLLVALNQLQVEGVADRVDKMTMLSDEARARVAADTTVSGRAFAAARAFYEPAYAGAYAGTPSTIVRLDSLIRAAARADAADDEAALAEAAEATYRSLLLNGHPNGYFMANAIADALGERALIDDVANPFAFVRLYNRAAERGDDGLPTFSAESMAYLIRLESCYLDTRR